MMARDPYSCVPDCFNGSGETSCVVSMSKLASAMMVSAGVGSSRDSTTNGALCGSGDISIDSMNPGEEEGGGVVRADPKSRFSNSVVFRS